MTSRENKFLTFGIRPIIEAIKSKKTIDKIFIQKGLNNDLFKELWKFIREQRINYKYVPIDKLNRITRKNHQGVIAFISPIDFLSIEDVIPMIFESGKNPLILVLDRVTDVRNFGAICRTAECSGVDAILVPEKNSAAINGDAIKTSAGALHNISICRTSNLKISVEFIKNSGLQIISCTEKGDKSVYDLKYTKPTAIIMGSEENGISDSLLKYSNEKAYIPIVGKTSSLNVSVATGIILFEVIRQQRNELV